MNLFTISNNSWNNQSITEKLTDISLEHKRLLASNRGYVIAPQKVLRCFRLSDLEIRVLLDLMSLMGEKDYAFPGHKYWNVNTKLDNFYKDLFLNSTGVK